MNAKKQKYSQIKIKQEYVTQKKEGNKTATLFLYLA